MSQAERTDAEPADSVSDHLLDALNLHRKGCAACRDSVDGCELAQRIEAVMLEVNPSAYFTSEPIEPEPIETPDEHLPPAAPTCAAVAGCDKLATAKGGKACVDHSGMVHAAGEVATCPRCRAPVGSSDTAAIKGSREVCYWAAGQRSEAAYEGCAQRMAALLARRARLACGNCGDSERTALSPGLGVLCVEPAPCMARTRAKMDAASRPAVEALVTAVRAHHAAMSRLAEHRERTDCFDTECRHEVHGEESEAREVVDQLLRSFPVPAAAVTSGEGSP